MKKIIYFMAATAMVTAMTGCSDDTYDLQGEGVVKFTATINNDVKVVSRAATQEELSSKCNIWISQVDRGLVRKYEGIDNLPAEGIKLLSGSYVAEAWTGDSVPASFEDKYYKAWKPFDVTAGSNENIELTLKIANVVTSVVYTPEVDEVLKDYTLKIEHTRGDLTFDGRDTRKGYFMMPNGVTDLNYTLTGTKVAGGEFVRTGRIADVKPTTEYVITVKCTGDDSELGGGYLSVEIDAKEILVEDEIVIKTSPSITGYQFNIKEPVYGEEGAIGRHSVWVMGSENLASVILESPVLNDGINLSLGGNDVDLVGASSAIINQLKAGGITVVYPWVKPSGADETMMKISFEESLLNNLTNGEYEFKISAEDKDGRKSTATFKVLVSDAKSAPVAVDMSGVDFSARTATLRGRVVKEGVESVGFEYRPVGSGAWTYVDGQPVSRALDVNSEFVAYVDGLNPGTAYEYRTVTDGVAAQATMQFTTEPATQLPNSGFEGWQQPAKPWLIYAAGEQMFWDSGNHGSTTLSANDNVTKPDSNTKHSGNYSLYMETRSIVGKLAAGNVFVGKYLKTDGTDGVLGFGRPFTGRPVKLKGYVKYSPAAISTVGAGAPSEYVKGQPDKGVIYIALLDSHTDSEYPEFPVVIKTKTKQLFNPESEHVIAYGALVFDEATAGDGLIPFEIPLTYLRTDIRPSFVLCTASASKGGDYFTGGKGSKMWLDDLELVY